MATKYLEFLVGNKHFGYPIEKIREIMEYPRIEPLSGAPEQVLGVMNLRGSLVVVFDIAACLGEVSAEVSSKTCVIVTEVEQGEQGAIVANKVDLVRQVMTIEPEQLEAIPVVYEQLESPLISAMAKLDARLLTILDIDKFLSKEQWQWLFEQHGEVSNE